MKITWLIIAMVIRYGYSQLPQNDMGFTILHIKVELEAVSLATSISNRTDQKFQKITQHCWFGSEAIVIAWNLRWPSAEVIAPGYRCFLACNSIVVSLIYCTYNMCSDIYC